jgi:hypothetical protein
VGAELNKDSEFFDLHFSKHVEKANSVGELLIAYDGVLNSETISKLEIEIEAKTAEKSLSKMVVKKVFFISIESLQNMFIHGFRDEKEAKHNFFIIYIKPTEVKIITANLISNTAIEKISNHIKTINSFHQPSELKSYYLEHLENNELSSKGGAGLGFITIAMKSGNKLISQFETINEVRSLFLLEITINLE